MTNSVSQMRIQNKELMKYLTSLQLGSIIDFKIDHKLLKLTVEIFLPLSDSAEKSR